MKARYDGTDITGWNGSYNGIQYNKYSYTETYIGEENSSLTRTIHVGRENASGSYLWKITTYSDYYAPQGDLTWILETEACNTTGCVLVQTSPAGYPSTQEVVNVNMTQCHSPLYQGFLSKGSAGYNNSSSTMQSHVFDMLSTAEAATSFSPVTGVIYTTPTQTAKFTFSGFYDLHSNVSRPGDINLYFDCSDPRPYYPYNPKG